MADKKLVIRVAASFAEKDELFSWLRKYASHYDQHFAYWDEFAFTADELSEVDGILVFNTPKKKVTTNTFRDWIIAFMMEPGIAGEHPWMFRELDQYNKVFSPLTNSGNTVQSHGYLGWYLKYNWNALESLQTPVKNKLVSCIASGLTRLRGHKKRNEFIRELRNEIPDMSFYGKGTPMYLDDKMEGLAPYKYSVAVENTSMPHYFTEKINDCFLAWTVPIYYGCTNIFDYFPSRSVIVIDIDKPVKTIDKIKEVLLTDDWNNRIDDIREARELVLNKYQPLAGAASVLRSIPKEIKQNVTIRPVTASLLERIIRKMTR